MLLAGFSQNERRRAHGQGNQLCQVRRKWRWQYHLLTANLSKRWNIDARLQYQRTVEIGLGNELEGNYPRSLQSAPEQSAFHETLQLRLRLLCQNIPQHD